MGKTSNASLIAFRAPQTAPKPPRGLGVAGRALWNRFQPEYGIRDVAGLVLLETACRCWDLERQALAAVAADGLTNRDKYGQLRPHPCLAAARDARAGFLKALASLHCDVEPVRDQPGRPGGR